MKSAVKSQSKSSRSSMSNVKNFSITFFNFKHKLCSIVQTKLVLTGYGCVHRLCIGIQPIFLSNSRLFFHKKLDRLAWLDTRVVHTYTQLTFWELQRLRCILRTTQKSRSFLGFGSLTGEKTNPGGLAVRQTNDWFERIRNKRIYDILITNQCNIYDQ